MPQIGPGEILVILVVVLLVFGPKRLPEVGRQVGRVLRELRKIQETVRGELSEILHADEPGSETAPRADHTSPNPSLPAGDPTRPTGAHAPTRFRAPSA